MPTWCASANGRIKMIIKSDQTKLNNHGLVTVWFDVNLPIITSRPKRIDASHAKNKKLIFQLYIYKREHTSSLLKFINIGQILLYYSILRFPFGQRNKIANPNLIEIFKSLLCIPGKTFKANSVF